MPLSPEQFRAYAVAYERARAEARAQADPLGQHDQPHGPDFARELGRLAEQLIESKEDD